MRIFANVKPTIVVEYNDDVSRINSDVHSGNPPSATAASCCSFSALLAAYGLGLGGGFLGAGRGVR